jgi:hypothetical protein
MKNQSSPILKLNRVIKRIVWLKTNCWTQFWLAVGSIGRVWVTCLSLVLSVSKTTEGIVGILIVLLTELKSPGIWNFLTSYQTANQNCVQQLVLADIKNLPSQLTYVDNNLFLSYSVPGDGNCFFHSLSLLKNGNTTNSSFYRNIICTHIIHNWQI